MNQKTIDSINGARHAFYDKNIEAASFSRKIITGDNYGSLISNYRPRESDKQKKQRVDITHVRTKSIGGKVTGFFDRVTRADKLRFEVSHDSDSDKANSLSSHLDVYGNNGESALMWVERAANFYNDIDANSMYWIKQSINEEGEQEFEPLIFTSEQVLGYSMKKGLVEWLSALMVDRVTYQNEGSTIEKNLDFYYYFDKDGLEISIELDEDVKKNTDYYNAYLFDVNGNDLGPLIAKANNKSYIVIQEEPYTDFVPITRVGYKYDLSTNQNTYTVRWDNASELYKILAEDGSGLDITKKLHIYPKQISYYTSCNHQDKDRSAICKGGTMFPHGGECPKCKGTGEQIHLSDQDVIKLKLPEKDDNTSINPKDLVHYVETPDKILDFQNEAVKAATPLILEAIFGVDLSYQETGNVTATQVNTYRDLAQDALFQFSQAPRHMYLFTAKVMQNALDLEDVRVELEYTNEYNLESEEYLIGLLKTATEANAPRVIVEGIIRRIVLKQNRTNKTAIGVHETMRSFIPFQGLNDAMKQQVIGSLPNSSYQKALYLNSSQITNEILQKEEAFLMLNYDEQKKKVDEIAKTFIDLAVKENKVQGIGENFEG